MTPLSVTFYNTLRMQSEYTSHAKRLSISRSCQIDIDSPSKNSLNRSEIITLLPDKCSNQFIEDLSFFFGYSQCAIALTTSFLVQVKMQ